MPVTLSDVDEDGVLMVQVHGPGLSRLQELMTLINTKFQVRGVTCIHFILVVPMLWLLL